MDFNKKDIADVMDLVRPAKEFIATVAAAAGAALEKIKIIRDAVDADLLDIPGGLLLSLESGGLGIEAALQGAEASIAEADKRIAGAAKNEAEIQVAAMMEYSKDIEGAKRDMENALGQALGRIEESRKFATLCGVRIKGLELPKLGWAAEGNPDFLGAYEG